jgi:serine/threonine-protein kinase HipA
MISLAAMLETTHRIPNLDYIHLFQVIEKICDDKNELYEAFRRMCFNVYYGNKDDHSKNFAFLYNEEKHSYELSPAFDITKTPEKFEHEMTVNGAGNPTDEDLLAVAKRFKLSMVKCKEIMAKLKKVIDR